MGEAIAFTIFVLKPMNSQSQKALDIRHNDNRIMVKKEKLESIILSLADPPRDIGSGFVFGRDDSSDICIKYRGVSDRHFAITFNRESGIPILVNKSSERVTIGRHALLKRGNSAVITDNMSVQLLDLEFLVQFPSRTDYEWKKYHGNLSKYVGSMIAPGAVMPSIHSTPVPTRQQIGNYWVVRKLGKGGFGEVTLLTHKATGGLFAAKKFTARQNIKQIQSEIGTLMKLSHPNIVHFVEHIQSRDGSLQMIMEHLQFGDLTNFSFTHAESLKVLGQSLKALQYIHQHGISHRDMKPQNIVVKTKVPLEVCIIDFGLAKEGSWSNEIAGTLIYVAPEVWEGRRCSYGLDIWVLGLTGLVLLDTFPDFNIDIKEADFRNLSGFIRAVTATCQKPRLEFARRLLSHMLDPNPKSRWSADTCLQGVADAQGALLQFAPEARQHERHQRMDMVADRRKHVTQPYQVLEIRPGQRRFLDPRVL